MDLRPPDGDGEVRAAVATLAAGAGLTPAAIHARAETDPGYDPAAWDAVMRAGWPTVAFPTSVGGGGGTLTDLVAAVEALARVPVPGPLHNGVLMSGGALLALADEAQIARHLVPLLGGEQRVALCLTEASGRARPDRLTCRARPDGGGWVIDGTKCFVPHAASADVLLVVAAVDDPGTTGVSLFAVDAAAPGVAVRAMSTLGGDRQAEVVLGRVRVGPAGLVGPPGGAWDPLAPVLDRAAVAAAADMVGAAGAALDWAVARVSARRQWGVPIGSFQAVQHRCADMLIDLTCASDAVWDVAGMADRGEDIGMAAAAAHALCAGACGRITAAAHQLCGGEGIYADQPLHLWYRRVKTLEPWFGGPRAGRQRVAASLLDG